MDLNDIFGSVAGGINTVGGAVLDYEAARRAQLGGAQTSGTTIIREASTASSSGMSTTTMLAIGLGLIALAVAAYKLAK